MPLKLIAPIVDTKFLTLADEKYGNTSEPSYVVIRQARQKEVMERQSLFNRLEQLFSRSDPGEVTLVQNISMEELRRKEVQLTLIESNITDEDGKLLFPSKQDGPEKRLALDSREFFEAWGSLPPDIADEIHSKVLEVNPLWAGPLGEG